MHILVVQDILDNKVCNYVCDRSKSRLDLFSVLGLLGPAPSLCDVSDIWGIFQSSWN